MKINMNLLRIFFLIIIIKYSVSKCVLLVIKIVTKIINILYNIIHNIFYIGYLFKIEITT